MAEQSFKSHTRWLPPFHFFVAPVMLINFLNEVRHLIAQQSLHNAWMVIFAAGLVMLALMSRIMPLTAQDRLIRLEQRLRMRELLPADLYARCDKITPRQFVALRFASDAELADLVRDVLDGKVQSSKDIKAKIKSWQPDFLRV